MASGLFGSGPQSGILNTVQSSYTGMLNAEMQKGKGVSAALGAFGEAISPKSLGMRQFKKDFADADWNDPATYMKAGQQIMQFDTNGGLSMIQRGQALAASQAPERDMQQITTRGADGSEVTQIVDVNAIESGTTFESAAPKKDTTNTSKMIFESTGFEEGTPEHQEAMTNYLNRANVVKNVSTPMQQTEQVSNYITKDKTYLNAKDVLTKVNNGLRLLEAAEDSPANNEKAATLLERTVSETYNSDTRAASEIDRLVKDRSWSRSIDNWLNNGLRGVPSGATLEEYRDLLVIMEEAMVNAANGVVKQQTELYSEYIDEDVTSNLVSAYALSTTPRKTPDGSNEEAQTKQDYAEVDSNLGTHVGTLPAGTPDGSMFRNGELYIVRGGNVYKTNEPSGNYLGVAPEGTPDGPSVDSQGNKIVIKNGMVYEAE